MKRDAFASLLMIFAAAGCHGGTPQGGEEVDVDHIEQAAVVNGGITLPTPPPIPTLPPDLVLWKLESTALGGGAYKISATLRNGGPLNKLYPGGGQLVIARDGVGVIPTNPGDIFYPSVSDLGTQLKAVPIPPLAPGQALVVSVNTNGRGVFSAGAVADPPIIDGPASQPLPEVNPNNNYKSLNTLLAHQITIDTSLLNLALGASLGAAHVRIDHANGLVSIPGFTSQSFGVPDLSKDVPYPIPFPPGAFWIGTAHLRVNDINSSSTSLSFAGGGLRLCLGFEEADPEVIGWMDDGPDALVPNVEGHDMGVCVGLPLSFNGQFRTFSYGVADVNVTGNYDLSGVWDIFGNKVTQLINDTADSTLTDFFAKQDNRDLVESKLNGAIYGALKDKFGNRGRINAVSIQAGQMVLDVETPSALPGGI